MRGPNGFANLKGVALSRLLMICDLISDRLIILSTFAIGIFGAGNTLAVTDKPLRRTNMQVASRDLAAAQAFMDQTAALSPRVRAEEAARLAECVYNTTHQLRRDYQVVWPPLFNNFLVNSGIKKRGLCFQWAEDLLVVLDGLKLNSLELHWGEAQVGTWHENNCVVVTAKGQPFNTGIILDCWRRSGHPYWRPVGTDNVSWVENGAYAHFVRAKSAAATDHPVASHRKIERQKKSTGALVEVSANAH